MTRSAKVLGFSSVDGTRACFNYRHTLSLHMYDFSKKVRKGRRENKLFENIKVCI